MKKTLVVILMVAVFFGALAVCCFYGNGQLAYAENNVEADTGVVTDTDTDTDADNADGYDEVYGSPVKLEPIYDYFYGEGVRFAIGKRYVYLYVYSKSGRPVGVRFRGSYFGASGIEVVADVYSSDALKIDFKINATKDALTDTQVQTRNTLIELFTSIHQMITDVDNCANTTYDGANGTVKSEIYQYNVAKQGETVDISYYTFDMLTKARTMYEATDGAFNPAVYRLVDLWGFSSRIYTHRRTGEQPYDRVINKGDTGYALPEQKYIDAFRDERFTDFSQTSVTLNANESDGKYTVTKNVAPAVVDGVEFDQWLDLGGIAKGYAVDKAREMIRQLGIERFYVNAGSSSIVTGNDYNGDKTLMGMLDAFDPYAEVFQTALFSVEVGKSSISTSGQNIRRYTVDGVEYAHILDGKTGAPAQTGVRSVMVVVPQEEGEYWATMGDCLTTALTVMGRDNIVQFANGYLKEHNIKIVVQYETLDGRKQLLSNYDQSDLTGIADSYPQFGWAMKLDDGVYYYDANAKFSNPTGTYTVALAVLGSVLGAAAIALVVYHFVRGRKRVTANVVNAKSDKPFKVLDVMLYVAVVLVILVLFYVFIFDTDTTQLQIVTVIDDETGETLVVYNVTRGEYMVNEANSQGWDIQVNETDDGAEIVLTRQVAGEEHYNKLQIVRGQKPSVQMIDSLCGFHQDCVHNFPAVTRSGGAIVCSPNRLKVVTA